jgi:hypothetical protein
MTIASINISANPVLAYETYQVMLPREHIERPVIDKRDMGGFYQMNFEVHEARANRVFAMELLVNGLSRLVRCYNHASNLVFEGFVGRVDLNTGTVKLSNDITDVFNKQWSRYNPAGTVLRSDTQENTDSQGRVGIREGVHSLGEISLGVANQAVQTIIKRNGFANPQADAVNIGGKVLDRPKLSMVVLGFWHTLGWQRYNQTATSADDAVSTILGDIITAVGEFVNSTDIATNVTQVNEEFDSDRTGLDLVQSLCGVGDGGLRPYVAGFRKDREFYYKQAAKDDI